LALVLRSKPDVVEKKATEHGHQGADSTIDALPLDESGQVAPDVEQDLDRVNGGRPHAHGRLDVTSESFDFRLGAGRFLAP
jgi:hypothetical protein